MFRNLFPFVFIFLMALSPPKNSWEFWIQAILNDGKDGLPGRPDNLNLLEPLPLWVDCHLSFYLDQPDLKTRPKIAKKLILRSTEKDCKGSLTERSHRAR